MAGRDRADKSGTVPDVSGQLGTMCFYHRPLHVVTFTIIIISNPHPLPMQSAPACLSSLTFVDRDTGERMNKNLITGNAIITFKTEHLRRNRYYNVTVNAANIQGSDSTVISTHGIQNTTYLMEGNGIRVETNYFRDSSPIGALYIFICVDSHGAINFSYQTFDRDGSPEHIPLVPYLVLAYDVESDGALYDGERVSFPASVDNLSNPKISHGKLSQMCVCMQYIRQRHLRPLCSSSYALCLATMPSVLPPMPYYSILVPGFQPSQNTHNHWAPLLHDDHCLTPMPSINPGENPVRSNCLSYKCVRLCCVPPCGKPVNASVAKLDTTVDYHVTVAPYI